MKILHTSDWHLGRTLHGENLHAHQEAFHDFLVDLVTARGVNVVVISGDVYDRAVPPTDAVRLLSRTLARLAEVATVILTPGNHDSATRLGFGAGLMRAGVHILADMPGIDHPVVMPDDHGDVLFFGLPYLEPDIARFDLAADGTEPLERSHEAVTRAALDRVHRRIENHDGADGAPRPRSVVLAHTFVTGGATSESERDIKVGGVDSVPAGVFDGLDYIALGHLHGCQDLTRRARAGTGQEAADSEEAAAEADQYAVSPGRSDVTPTAWYSGSPLAFSFSEKDHHKCVLLIDLGEPGHVGVERVPAPVPRALTELRGRLEDVLAQAGEHGNDWLKVTITDPARPAHLQEKLRAAYPHLLHTEFDPEGRETRHVTPQIRAESDPLEVMDDFLGFVTGAAPTAEEHAVFDTAYQAVRTTREEAS